MGVLVEKFKSDFKLKATGQKGWFYAPNQNILFCPICHNTNGSKLAFIFSEKCSSFHCPKCDASMRLEKYLWLVKKQEYIFSFRPIKKEDIMRKKELFIKKQIPEQKILESVELPLFFKKLRFSSYLKNRGAKLDLFKYWTIGKTDFEKDLKDYIIFVIPENGINVGWVARSQKSKKEIDSLNKNSKRKILRWRNSKSDFGQIVFGLDEIDKDTEELIIVEGITSKMRIDCELELYKQSKIKCVCTFGKKMTDIQLKKIKDKSANIKKIILFYDSDAIKASKKTVYELNNHFDKVFVAFCNYTNEEGEYKDAGDLNKEELLNVLSKIQTPFSFFESKLEKKRLI